MSGFDPSYILKAVKLLLEAVPTVLIMLGLSIFFGMTLGLLFTLVRIRRVPVLRQVVSFLISFLRGTPQLVQLFIVYYGIPQFLRNLGFTVSSDNRMFFAVITFSLNASAVFSEAFRSAYLAIDKGQREAAVSIGMNAWQRFRKVLFPQGFRVVLPNIGNLTIRMLQATSLAFSIGMIDLMGRAKIIDNWTFGVNRLAVYIAVSLIYWGICLVLELILHILEKRFTFGHVDITGNRS